MAILRWALVDLLAIKYQRSLLVGDKGELTVPLSDLDHWILVNKWSNLQQTWHLHEMSCQNYGNDFFELRPLPRQFVPHIWILSKSGAGSPDKKTLVVVPRNQGLEIGTVGVITPSLQPPGIGGCHDQGYTILWGRAPVLKMKVYPRNCLSYIISIFQYENAYCESLPHPFTYKWTNLILIVKV
jgi:hypothetical protein